MGVFSIFDFRISGQSLIKENYYNSITNDDITWDLDPLTKRNKRNGNNVKKDSDEIMSKHCDVIVIFLIYVLSGAIRKPDFGVIVCKTYFKYCFHK